MNRCKSSMRPLAGVWLWIFGVSISGFGGVGRRQKGFNLRLSKSLPEAFTRPSTTLS